MKNEKASSSALLSYVAASAADRGLTAPTINPLVSLAATLAGRLLGLFRQPPEGATTRPARARPSPVDRPERGQSEGRAKAKRRGCEHPPGKHPKVRSVSARCVAHVNLGGPSHG